LAHHSVSLSAQGHPAHQQRYAASQQGASVHRYRVPQNAASRMVLLLLRLLLGCLL